jgi:FkbM family methyltransferase
MKQISDLDIARAATLNNVGIDAASLSGDALHAGIAMLRRAVALNPKDHGCALNLATILVEAGEYDEIESICAAVVKENERSPGAWQLLGVVKTNQGKMDEAISCFKKAYDLQPTDGQRRFDLAAAYLRAGDFANGLPFYEHRAQILPKTGEPPNAPTWKGEKTGHLAIWPDQGHGDVIMFSRFVKMAVERADKVTFFVTPQLLLLFQGFSQICEVATVYGADTKYDHQICLASLPLVFGVTPQTIPPDPGLLSVANSEGRLPGEGLRIGIAWQGNKQFPGDKLRSIPFREFLPLASDPRNTVYSIQVGPASADIAKARAQRIVKDMSPDIEGEWTHTAALIKNLDLVISSCTAIPHLSSALGIPTFIMLPLFADWRWLHGRDDTPWYPKTRLFRQTKVGDWSSVMKRVMAAVNHMHDQIAVARLLKSPTVANPTLADHKEPDVAHAIRKILRPGDTFVDVGANIGMHTLLAAELVGDTGKVLAFEPGENALPELRKSCEGISTIEIIDEPLWSKTGSIDFYLCADGSGGNATWDPGKYPTNEKTRADPQKRTLLATTLDWEVVKERKLQPRLIKIDTEGAEQRILEGAKKLLAKHRPDFIITEFHEFGLKQLGCTEKTFRVWMAQYGYHVFQLFADGSKPHMLQEHEKIKAPNNFIINLLFSTEAAVNELWPEDARTDMRPVHGYKTVVNPEFKPTTKLERKLVDALNEGMSVSGIPSLKANGRMEQQA